LSNVNDNSILLPTNDVCFEKLMDNPKVRKGLSAALLEIDPKMIKDTTLLKNKTERSSIDDKYGILDVKILLVNGTIINLEMQIRKYDYWDKRILFYMSKSYTSQIHTGDEYEELKKCIHASILDFIQFPNDDKCYRKIQFCDVDYGEVYTDMFEIHIMELKKLSKDTRTDKPIIRWMKFFNCKTREEFENMKNIDEYIQEAYDELVRFCANKELREKYEDHEKTLRDNYAFLCSAKREGLAEGRAKGRAEGRAETISLLKQMKRLHKEGKSFEEIALELGFSIDEVRDILE